MEVLKNNIQIALSSIKGNWLRSVLTMLIISFGIMALVGIMTASDALVAALVKNYGTLGTNTFSISPVSATIQSSRGRSSTYYKEFSYKEAMNFKDKFSKKGEVSVSFTAPSSYVIKYQEKETTQNVAIQCIDENFFDVTNRSIEFGRGFKEKDIISSQKNAVVGPEIVTILFNGDNEKAIGEIINIGTRYVKIIGVAESLGSNFDSNQDNTVFIPISLGSNIYARIHTNYDIQVKIDDPTNYLKTIDQSIPVLRAVRKLQIQEENDFEIEKSDALLKEIQKDTSSIRSIVLIIAIITLIGSAVGLLNIMLVSVTERTKEIGIRKAIGASSQVILQQFLVEAIVICILGGIIGIILGILIGNIVSILMKSDFVVPVNWIIIGFVICFIVGIAAGIYPARKAAALDPIDALRYDS